jgi:hypothetical protein
VPRLRDLCGPQVRALTWCDLNTLSRADLVEVSAQFPCAGLIVDRRRRSDWGSTVAPPPPPGHTPPAEPTPPPLGK